MRYSPRARSARKAWVGLTAMTIPLIFLVSHSGLATEVDAESRIGPYRSDLIRAWRSRSPDNYRSFRRLRLEHWADPELSLKESEEWNQYWRSLLMDVDIMEGVFLGLETGMTRNQVIGVLRELEVEFVMPATPFPFISEADDLDKISKEASGIELLPPSILVEFDSDGGARWESEYAPQDSEWVVALDGAKDRTEVLRRVAGVLSEHPGGDFTLREANLPMYVSLDENASAALEAVDTWMIHLGSPLEKWTVTLSFGEGELVRIEALSAFTEI